MEDEEQRLLSTPWIVIQPATSSPMTWLRDWEEAPGNQSEGANSSQPGISDVGQQLT